jgi:hypothetical protein
MSKSLGAVLTSDEIKALEREIIAEARAGRKLAAWHRAQPLRKAQSQQPEAAIALLGVVNEQCLEREPAINLLS